MCPQGANLAVRFVHTMGLPWQLFERICVSMGGRQPSWQHSCKHYPWTTFFSTSSLVHCETDPNLVLQLGNMKGNCMEMIQCQYAQNIVQRTTPNQSNNFVCIRTHKVNLTLWRSDSANHLTYKQTWHSDIPIIQIWKYNNTNTHANSTTLSQ